MIFEKTGSQNTDEALRIAIEAAQQRNIAYLVVASTYGDTAEKALKRISQTSIKLIIVTHNTGFANPDEQKFDPAIRAKIEAAGVAVLTGTMVLRNLNAAIRDKFYYSETELVIATLRMFCQGIKVCVEMAAMVCDAGLAPPEDMVCVAGTGHGADTVAIIKGDSSNRFFNIKVREILAKPRDF